MPRPSFSALFVTSAVKPADFPHDGRPEIALAGRSNVGKSSLINALLRQDVARTSSAPGKTRQVNVYRVWADGGRPFYLMDLPGYGHASGGVKAREEFAGLVSLYVKTRTGGGSGHAPAAGGRSALRGVVLAIDARHPDLASDVDAWRWLASLGVPSLLVATKIDKLSQAERARLTGTCAEAFGHAPLCVSALKGSGFDDLWKQLHALAA